VNSTSLAINSPVAEDAKVIRVRPIIEQPALAGDSLPFSGKPDRGIVILSKPRPSYTSEARRAGDTGEVLLKVLFSASGRVEKVEAISGPKSLFKSAISAAEKIQFIPAQNAGKPVSVWKELTYTFSIY
jgi:TonB family protein